MPIPTFKWTLGSNDKLVMVIDTPAQPANHKMKYVLYDNPTDFEAFT